MTTMTFPTELMIQLPDRARAGSYRPKGAGPRAWIATIARNAARDRLRYRRVRPQVEPLEPAETLSADLTHDPVEVSLRSELRQRVHAALQAINAHQRETLELAYFLGLSQREIAQRTRSRLGTVKSRMRLAMQHMRALLEPPGADGGDGRIAPQCGECLWGSR